MISAISAATTGIRLSLDRFDQAASSLVQAHYRVSIVAGALATRCRPEGAVALRALIVQILALEDVTVANLATTLQLLAERENRIVLQMLGPFYALSNELRMRTQFEPHAHERRQLKHTAGISKHCVWARTMLTDTDVGLRRRWSFWWRSKAVHVFHLRLGWGSLSWQAYYNAASFDALVLQRKQHIAAVQAAEAGV